MDKALENLEQSIEPRLTQFGTGQNVKPVDTISDLLDSERFVHSYTPLTDIRSG
jgi:hypothetical protein